ncbi:MAG: hypothetical protein EXS14_10875 [Planctomycetes bacterium]|nr:hypothetical protein [Planctomycetota bacterium]
MKTKGWQHNTLQRLLEVTPAVTTTPLIDVVFLLLIFFLCTLRFRSVEARLTLDLPMDRGLGGLAVQALQEPLRLELIAEGAAPPGSTAWPLLLRRRGAKVPIGRILGLMQDPTDSRRTLLLADPPDTLQRLETWLGEIHRELGDHPVRVEAGEQCAHAAVVSVIDTVLAAGFKRVDFSAAPTRPESRLVPR